MPRGEGVGTGIAGMFAPSTAGVSSAVAIRSTELAPSFANYIQLQQRGQYLVAISQSAARRQVQTDHYRPRVSRSGYRANSNLDADNDGTACEVSL